MKWQKDLQNIIEVKYPIVQAPMFGVTTPEMVAAANNANCLGSLALGDLNANKCIEVIRQTKQLTNKPFIANIFVHQIPELTEELKLNYLKTKLFIEKFAEENNLDVDLPEINEIEINSYHEQVDAIISENCKLVSFTFGNLDIESINKLKENNTLLIGTCTSLEEALILEKSGIDIVCVQGWEAGGHRGSFETENIPQTGGFALLSTIHSHLKTPIIYAGGIVNAKSINAAKELGASGVQIGSLLLNSKESALKNFEKTRLQQVKENEIVLTKSFSGRYARGIKNKFMNKLDHTDFILPYPYQNKMTNELRKIAKLNSNSEFTNIWVGQAITNYSTDSTTEILNNLIKDLYLKN